MADLVVDSFERHSTGHSRRDVVLQGGAENATCNRYDEQPHQRACERTAKMKTAMEKNHRQRQEAEPEVTAHPRLRSAKAPGGHTLSRAE